MHILRDLDNPLERENGQYLTKFGYLRAGFHLDTIAVSYAAGHFWRIFDGFTWYVDI